MKTYCVTFIKTGQRHGRTIYTGESRAQARKAAADALGYRDLRSAYDYTSTTQDGEDGVFYCRRKESRGEDFDVAIITADHTPSAKA